MKHIVSLIALTVTFASATAAEAGDLPNSAFHLGLYKVHEQALLDMRRRHQPGDKHPYIGYGIELLYLHEAAKRGRAAFPSLTTANQRILTGRNKSMQQVGQELQALRKEIIAAADSIKDGAIIGNTIDQLIEKGSLIATQADVRQE